VKFDYSRSYYPPIPVIEISLISVAESLRVGPMPALVDTGADGTVAPVALLRQIQAPVTVEMMVRGQWGESRPVLLYLVDVQIGDVVVPGVEVVGDDVGDELILGRDVLNRLNMRLNGPQEMVELRL
jgi:predicted aspartyl protease